MKYLFDRKVKKRKLVAASFVVAFIVLFAFIRFPIFGSLSSFAHILVTPVWKAKNSVKDRLSSYTSLTQSKKSLLKENKLLKDRLEEYRVDLLYKDVLFDENQKLKEIFQRAESEPELILGVILSKPNRSSYDTLIIDLGKNSGINKGDYVFARGNILLGQVEEVFKKSSKIKLFSTPGEELGIVINESDIYTTITGRGGGNFEMTLPRDVEIEEGVEVVLPGITPYLIATVEKINYDPRDPLQNILLRNLVNIQQLKFVQVLKET